MEMQNKFEDLVNKVKEVSMNNEVACFWTNSRRHIIETIIGIKLENVDEQYHKGCLFIKLPDEIESKMFDCECQDHVYLIPR